MSTRTKVNGTGCAPGPDRAPHHAAGFVLLIPGDHPTSPQRLGEGNSSVFEVQEPGERALRGPPAALAGEDACRLANALALGWADDGDNLPQDDGIVRENRLIRRLGGHQPHVAFHSLQCLHGGLGGRGVPSHWAATISPSSATGCCRTTTRSPSVIAAPVIESPLTCRANNFP